MNPSANFQFYEQFTSFVILRAKPEESETSAITLLKMTALPPHKRPAGKNPGGFHTVEKPVILSEAKDLF